MTTELGLPRERKVHDYIDCIRDQLDYQRTNPNPNAFQLQYMAALEWALPVLEAEELDLIRIRRAIYLLDPHHRPGLGNEEQPQLQNSNS